MFTHVEKLQGVGVHHAPDDPFTPVDSGNLKISAALEGAQAQGGGHGISEKPPDCLVSIGLLDLRELAIGALKPFGNRNFHIMRGVSGNPEPARPC